MATTTQLDAIMRDDYKDLWENLNNATFILAQVTTKKDTVNGRIAQHSIHTGRSGGVGARQEGDDLPTADRQRYAVVPVPVRWQTGRIELTKQLMSMATGEPGAFADAMDTEMTGIKNDSMRDVNRQIWGTSNGVIATCGTTSASATVQLLATTPAVVMRAFYIGRFVDIGTVASPFTVAQTRQITAVDTVNKTITISGATVSTTSGTHFIFNSGSGGATTNTGKPNDGQRELTGLQTIVSDTGILHTVNPATEPVWKAQSYTNSGTLRNLAETSIDLAIMNNQIESGKSIGCLVSNAGVFISGKAILSAYNRNADVLDFKGGFKGIKWSTPGISGMDGKELGWYADFDCPSNSLYGLNVDEGLVCHQIEEGWQWMDDDGSILSRVPNKLAFEATIYSSLELACVQRNAHFRIGDLNEATI
jgi:hypothetical protein